MVIETNSSPWYSKPCHHNGIQNHSITLVFKTNSFSWYSKPFYHFGIQNQFIFMVFKTILSLWYSKPIHFHGIQNHLIIMVFKTILSSRKLLMLTQPSFILSCRPITSLISCHHSSLSFPKAISSSVTFITHIHSCLAYFVLNSLVI